MGEWKTTHMYNGPSEPIAIIGIGCRFSGDVRTPEQLWKLCADGRDGWAKVPRDRFNADAFYHMDYEREGMTNVVGGHFIRDDVASFDAPFFGLSEEMASSLDPQIRMLLELTFEAAENVGSNTSVYTGAFSHDYHDSQHRDPDTLPRTMLSGNGAAMLSNRISHFFDLRGPSLTTDTGCSASLAALHLGVQSLRVGESDMALVGAANLLLNPDPFIVMSGLGVLGHQGKCFAWDARAQGYGRGEGVATLLLKPLDKALRDGDPVHAVIRETALNQDGKTPTITTPSAEMQEALIRECYRRAGLDPAQTAYVEAHMTGTKTGDPIEASAVGRVFGQARDANNPVLVGSVKTNLGHLEAASGIAGVIKAAMALKRAQIPPNVNFESPNPLIDMKALRVAVPRKLAPWPLGVPLRASVNNYGYGGTNGHVILDAPPPPAAQRETGGDVGPYYLFVLSSKEAKVTRQMATGLADHLSTSTSTSPSPVELQDLAYTLSYRRTHFPWGAAVSASSPAELTEALKDVTKTPVANRAKSTLNIAFVFNGQGAQWYAMGRELSAYATFRESMARADRALRMHGAQWSLVEELGGDEHSTRIDEPWLSQPACVALQICLVDLLAEFGIKPAGVVGHSSGEVPAAYAAGVLTFEQALGVVYLRGALTEKYQHLSETPGAMLAVGLGHDKVLPYLVASNGKVTVACVNSPESTTLSGDADHINEIEENLKAHNIFARRLRVKSAYHSHHMKPMGPEYLAELERLLTSPTTPGQLRENVIYASPVSGDIKRTTQTLGAQNWVDNLVNPVLFAPALERLCSEGDDDSTGKINMLLEIGPHSALSGPIRQILTGSDVLKARNIRYTSALVRGQHAVQTIQAAAGIIWSNGGSVDLAAINNSYQEGTAAAVRVLTDLPPYPWNHSTRYWREPKANVKHRLRKHVRHELLGSLMFNSGETSPTWRNFLRLSDLPWLRDHVVGGDVVFPAAGGISMAIEAMKQLQQEQQQEKNDDSGYNMQQHGYRLRDVNITNAMVVPETMEGIEVQLSLHKCDDGKMLESGWYEFSLHSLRDGGDHGTMEHCHGYILPVPSDDWLTGAAWASSSSSSPPGINSLSLPRQGDTSASAGKVITPEQVFQDLRRKGLFHGPSFNNLLRVCTHQQSCHVDFEICKDLGHLESYTVHPTTLDSALQSAFPALSVQELDKAMVVPRSIAEMEISADLSNKPGTQLKAAAEIHKGSRSGFWASIQVEVGGGATTQSTTTPLLRIKNLFCAAVAGGGEASPSPSSSSSAAQPAMKNMMSRLVWRPDVTLATRRQLEDPLRVQPKAETVALARRLQRAALHLINDTLARTADADVDAMEWHHQRLHAWMKRQVAAADHSSGLAWRRATEGLKRQLADSVAAESVDGELLRRVGLRLHDILTGRATPLEVMTEAGLLNRYYETHFRLSSCFRQLEQVVRQLAFKEPRARVLEVGGGTGGCTPSVLAALTRDAARGRFDFASYTFTDVSAGFFQAASNKLADWGDMVDYKTLNIEQDPEEQGFEAGAYDLVVACQCLHATTNMERSLTHVRKLLRPGGRLLLVETTKDTLDVQMIFGTLPGWWLAEEQSRKDSPNLKLEQWESLLPKTGFSGFDISVRDCEDDDNYSFNVMLTTAVGKPMIPNDIVLVCPDVQGLGGPCPPQPWLDGLASALRSSTAPGDEQQATISTGTLASARPEDKVCILLQEAVSPLLANMSSEQFYQLQHLVTTAKAVIWVSRAGVITGAEPELGMHTGLLRTLNLEDASRRYVSLDLDPNEPPWSAENIRHIAAVFAASLDFSMPRHEVDLEYAVQHDRIYVSRLHQDDEENQKAFGGSQEVDHHQPTELLPFEKTPTGHNLRLCVAKPGLLDTLRFEQVAAPDELEPPADDELEIEPRAFGLNFRDVLIALGQLNQDAMGHECSGVVRRVGRLAAENGGFKPGDAVCGILRGHFATTVRVNWGCMVKIPTAVLPSFVDAATIPMVFATAYYSLVNKADLSPGETLLVHSAAGGVGQAAIMLARRIGAVVYATVGSEAKRDFLVQRYGIPAERIFSSRDGSFAKAIMAATDGRGVDVALNSLAGARLQETWACMARFGRFIEMGRRDLEAGRSLDMAPYGRAVSFSAVDIFQLGLYKAEALQQVLREVMDLFQSGHVCPVGPVTTYSIADSAKAFRLMQSGKHMGKIVITAGQEHKVRVVETLPPAVFQSDRTYLLAGGLGGIGLSIAKWLAKHGARNLVLVSRSAEKSADAKVVAEELRTAYKCKTLIHSCDLADSHAVENMLADVQRHMPHVQGVIQAAMSLNDATFVNMTYDQWQAGIRPKVATSHLLHRLLPTDMDFFIMLSSLCGLAGNASQANYATGNVFQDQLARHRSAAGMHAVSVDLASVTEVGWVANMPPEVSARLHKTGMDTIDERDLHRIIHAATARRPPHNHPTASHMVTGIREFDRDSGVAWLADKRFQPLCDHDRCVATPGGDDAKADGGAGRRGANKKKTTTLSDSLRDAQSAEGAVETVEKALVGKLTDMFRLDPGDIDLRRPAGVYGVDSLVAVELRNWLVAAAGADAMSIFDVLHSPSLGALAARVAQKSRYVTSLFASVGATV
ncbi:Type I Iterative PKS [Pyricularia oryzae]|nr:Type I Iterative PKS [Pyricularia oryzae]